MSSNPQEDPSSYPFINGLYAANPSAASTPQSDGVPPPGAMNPVAIHRGEYGYNSNLQSFSHRFPHHHPMPSHHFDRHPELSGYVRTQHGWYLHPTFVQAPHRWSIDSRQNICEPNFSVLPSARPIYPTHSTPMTQTSNMDQQRSTSVQSTRLSHSNTPNTSLEPNHEPKQQQKSGSGVNALLSAISMIASPPNVKDTVKDDKISHGSNKKRSNATEMNPNVHETPSSETRVSSNALRDISNHGSFSSHAARMEKAIGMVSGIQRQQLMLSKKTHAVSNPKRPNEDLQHVDEIKRQRQYDTGMELLCHATDIVISDSKNRVTSNNSVSEELSADRIEKDDAEVLQDVHYENDTSQMYPRYLSKKTGCNCPKSRCIKLYCECFANSDFCSPDCKCTSCYNTVEHNGSGGVRTMAIQSILSRNPHSFRKDKFVLEKKYSQSTEVTCRCVKSRCLKLYCDCFQGSVVCNESCLCVNCLNTEAESGENGERTLARNICLIKRADAFEVKTKETGNGCKCKTNRCVKKYCDCFANGITCSEKNCICRDCENGKKSASTITFARVEEVAV